MSINISIHAPTRGATCGGLVTPAVSILFQSTLPREERPSRSCVSPALPDFNPRSHERSDQPVLRRRNVRSISIHAPTRGATEYAFLIIGSRKFQSTLPREERRAGSKSFSVAANFNPRSHERSDRRRWPLRQSRQTISIHAPTRGATAILHKKFVYFYTIPTINI